MKKKVVIISDLHCGHRAGLTPPDWQYSAEKDSEKRKWGKLQSELWNQYLEIIQEIKSIDVLIVNGDMVDGKNLRAGGSELITSDRIEQANMAVECINAWKCKTIVMTYGTPYHGGVDEDWEKIVAKEVDADIQDHGFYDIAGFIFDVKHHISKSAMPYGQITPLLREGEWNIKWSVVKNNQPRADVLIRSHVHYKELAYHDNCWHIITPALMGLGSKFGARICSNIVDWGVTLVEVEKDKEISSCFITPEVQLEKSAIRKL